jgi:hypothetical protein
MKPKTTTIPKETTMRRKRVYGAAAILISFLFAAAAQGQSGSGDIYWHIDPNVKTCSMVINPSLTQSQWHRFIEQVGAIASYKSLAPATTLGKMNFNIAIDDANTPVDQHDLAWINTFVHPDETCPLGDAVSYPTIRASMGVNDNMDIGGYWTTAPRANYGMVGGEFKYAFLRESAKYPAAAVRTSVVLLTGVPDFNLNIYSVELMASKKIAVLTPYVGLKENLVIGTETTSKVDLKREILPASQGYVGVAYSIWKFGLAAEYDVSSVNTLAVALGFRP